MVKNNGHRLTNASLALPGLASTTMQNTEPFVERDTLAIGAGSSHRRILLGLELIPTETLVGRDAEAYRGMLVRLTAQGAKRRAEARKGGAYGPTASQWQKKEAGEAGRRVADANANRRVGEGELGVGKIIRVHGNWTCDVEWENESCGAGYSCGAQGGKNGRAFHLMEAVVMPKPRPRVSSPLPPHRRRIKALISISGPPLMPRQLSHGRILG